MAPSDNVLATKLLTSSESKSAYKLQTRVKIADNAPIMFSDRSNKNEPIIDYNQLLSSVNIELPQSIILYSTQCNKDNVTLTKDTQQSNNNNNNEDKEDENDDCLLADSFWQKQFDTKTKIQKHYVLQNNNSKYRDLQFEYDQHYKFKANSDENKSTEPLLQKLIKNKSHQIKVKSSHHFKNVVEELRASNPALFKDPNSMNDDENMQYKQQMITKNLRRLTGYDEIDESELLAINPHNIKTNDGNLDSTQLFEQNQCDFESEIIIDDEDGWNSNQNDNNECIQEQIQYQPEDDDFQMADINASKSVHKVIELQLMS